MPRHIVTEDEQLRNTKEVTKNRSLHWSSDQVVHHALLNNSGDQADITPELDTSGELQGNYHTMYTTLLFGKVTKTSKGEWCGFNTYTSRIK